MISSVFNKEIQTLESQFKNDVYLNDIIEYISEIKENVSYPRALKILIDAKLVTFKFSVNDLEAIVAETYETLKYYDSVINAIIIDSPEAAALSTIFQELANNNKYNFSVFSTDEAALNWLNTS